MASHHRDSRGGGRLGTFATGAVLLGMGVAAVIVIGKVWTMPFTTQTIDRSPPPVLVDLRNLSEFHAAQAQFELVLDQEEDVKWLPQVIAGERVQFVAVGSVDAIIDFSRLPTSAIAVSADGESVTVSLPRPTIDEAVLDLDAGRVMNRDRGVLNRVGGVFTDNPTSERELLLNAQEKMEAAAAQTDLVQRAEDNTKNMLYTMLRGLGFERVDVRFDDQPQAVETSVTEG
jgi:hypothetical protein